jgi:hypothetical protein
MSKITSSVLASQLVHPGDSSSQIWLSDEVKANAYYGSADGMHTVQVSLADFVGKIEFQGSLATYPTVPDWVTITFGSGITYGSVDTTGLLSVYDQVAIDYSDGATENLSYNFIGNFVWFRVYVTNWTQGIIQTIKVTY